MPRADILAKLAPQGAVLSVIVVTPGSYRRVIPLLRKLRAQTIREKLEIVFVTTTPAELEADEDWLSVFACWQAVGIGKLVSMAASRAAGIRAARCRYIVFTEQHAFPEESWAAAIVDAFETRGADAVGPVMDNANPALAISWINLSIEYGEWLAPHSGGWMEHLPGHNAAYRRDLLVEMGDELVSGLESEYGMHRAWRTQGRRLWLEPGARVRHVNITIRFAHLNAAFAFQRPWAKSRARHWGWPRRIAYALAWPLIAVVRLPRALRNFRRTRQYGNNLTEVLPWILGGVVASSFGEFLGYLGSVGNSDAVLLEAELYRERFLAPNDAAGRALFD